MMEKEENPPDKPKKRSVFKIIRRGLKYFCLFVLFLLLGCAGFAWWSLDISSGQAWLVKTVNTALARGPDDKGLSFKLLGLSGVVPFNFTVGIESADENGVWLSAPEISFEWDWRKLPGALEIARLKITNPDLSRFPALPPSPPEPSSPFGIAELKKLLTEAESFLSNKHWWLPQIYINGIELEKALLPADLVPQKEADKRLELDAAFNASLVDGKIKAALSGKGANSDDSLLDMGQFQAAGLDVKVSLAGGAAQTGLNMLLDVDGTLVKPLLNVAGLSPDFLGSSPRLELKIEAAARSDGVKLQLAGPNLAAGQLSLATKGDWQSGVGWKDNQLDGPFTLDLSTRVTPMEGADTGSPLNIVRAPAQLAINVQGNLPQLSLSVALDCPDLKYDNYQLADLRFEARSAELDVPLTQAGLKALENENAIKTSLYGKYLNSPINFTGDVFFQALRKTENGDETPVWRAGIRNLVLEALGLDCKGNLAALIPPEAKPLLDGSLELSLKNWQGVNLFVPAYKFAGTLQMAAVLTSGLENNPLNKLSIGPLFWESLKSGRQDVDISIAANELKIREAGGESYNVGRLNLKGTASDIFKDLSLDAFLDAAKIQAAGFTFGASAKVKGALKGPLAAEVKANGDIAADLDAVWQPGLVNLKSLNISLNSAKLLKAEKRSLKIGVQTARPSSITYGEKGIGISGLDVKITPSGRLQANGGLSAEKLDLKLLLENLDFKPWQNLVPQIPSGSASLDLKLAGTPALPAGNFKATLNRIKIPKAPLGPVSLTLGGDLRHGSNGSVFAVRMNIDKETLNTLGASTASVSGQVPLRFAGNGIPALDRNGEMRAAIHWDGALGPIWNLVPVADQRLNGRLKIDLNASGSLQKPKIRGGVHVEKARYENILYGVLLTDIGLDLKISENGRVEKIGDMEVPGAVTLAARISDGYKGTVKINGGCGMAGDNLDVKIAINRLKPLRRRDIHVELSGDVTVQGAAASPDIKGKVIVDRGEVLLDNIEMTGSVTTLDITTPEKAKKQAEAKAASAGAGFGNLDVGIRMLPRFRVDGRGLGSIWQANLLVQGPINNPQITGTINAVSGNFDFLGKLFELTRGTVTFAGGSISNPMLDIQLTNETPDLTAKISVVGTVKRMRLILTSDPSMPRDEILSRVLFGKSINDLSRLEALQLAAGVAQLAGFGGGGGILNMTKKALGIDVLRIGTSSSSSAGDEDSSADGTTIEAGKYITDKLYMGVQQGLKADSTAFIIQYELTPRTSIELWSEQNNTWGGFNWKYNY